MSSFCVSPLPYTQTKELGKLCYKLVQFFPVTAFYAIFIAFYATFPSFIRVIVL